MVPEQVDHLWDCCCDHGFLGQELMLRYPDVEVHFVDITPSIIDRLKDRLCIEMPNGRWQTHCCDAALLPVTDTGDDARHIVMIAGVGGDLMLDIVRSLARIFAGRKVQYLLCPVYHTYKLREGLRELGLGLLDERLVTEKGRCYEVISVALDGAQDVSAVGSTMWNFDDREHQSYYQSLVSHYQRVADGGREGAREILQQYQSLAAEAI